LLADFSVLLRFKTTGGRQHYKNARFAVELGARFLLSFCAA
jgi:hypothetical protein